MAFKMVLDSLEGLPEDVAKEYVERDGKFHIQVEGMRPPEEFTRLQSSLTAARADADKYKGRLAMLGDRKVEDVVSQLDRIPELEAAAADKLDEDKLNELAERRAAARIAPIERERDQLKTTNEELLGKVGEYEAKDRTRSIHDAVRSAAKEVGVIDSAIEDALLLSDRVMERDETGAIVVKNEVGFSPGLGPKDWLADLRDKRPHWFGESSGGGAGGNRGGAGGGVANPWSHDKWNMTEQGKIYKEDPVRAKKLAEAAGTIIGGARPEPKK